jgi:16S rRNA (uracil1498-N3)-methyltransferase
MRRFFVEEVIKRDGYCIITGNEARHISKVLRMEKGDNFILMDSGGNRFEAVIESSDCNDIVVKLKRPLPAPTASPVEIDLCQALLKSRSMEYIIEKTSELGVNSITPFSSERTVIKLVGKSVSVRLRRWNEIAKSATKQADRIKPAEIAPPVSLKDLMVKCEGIDDLKIILWEKEESRDLKKLLKSSQPCRRLLGLVGPEGGFSQKEAAMAKEAGFIPVSLGRRILRAETAAITLVAIVQYEWGDLSLNQ